MVIRDQAFQDILVHQVIVDSPVFLGALVFRGTVAFRVGQELVATLVSVVFQVIQDLEFRVGQELVATAASPASVGTLVYRVGLVSVVTVDTLDIVDSPV